MTGSVQACLRHDWQFAIDTSESVFTVGLTRLGACCCRADGVDLAPWEVLMKVLEPLFFR